LAVETSRQTLAGAKADEERARLAYGVNIAGVNTTVARLRSELAGAEFDLAQTTVRAYANGFVTQVALRPGMYAVPYSFRPDIQRNGHRACNVNRLTHPAAWIAS
jgi:multidrug resistance efflux pump